MIYEISSIKDERLQLFTSMTEAQLRNRLNQEQGVFIAESPKVIRVALQAGYQPQALLCEQSILRVMLVISLRLIPRCPSIQAVAKCFQN